MSPSTIGQRKLVAWQVDRHEDPYNPKSKVGTAFYCVRCYSSERISTGVISKIFEQDLEAEKAVCTVCGKAIEG